MVKVGELIMMVTFRMSGETFLKYEEVLRSVYARIGSINPDCQLLLDVSIDVEDTYTVFTQYKEMLDKGEHVEVNDRSGLLFLAQVIRGLADILDQLSQSKCLIENKNMRPAVTETNISTTPYPVPKSRE
jgi:hypothetical protein